jgi:hypothetical protein
MTSVIQMMLKAETQAIHLSIFIRRARDHEQSRAVGPSPDRHQTTGG